MIAYQENNPRRRKEASGVKMILTKEQRKVLRDHAAEIGVVSLGATLLILAQKGLDLLHADTAADKKPRLIPLPKRKAQEK